jgi:hypothetical protein
MKIQITAKAREIMVELVNLHETFYEQTRTLASADTDYSTAINIGADRESVKAQILGAAYRLTKEITGQK